MRNYGVIKAALDVDPEVTKEQKKAALAILKGGPRKENMEEGISPVLFTQVEAAKFLNVSRTTIYRLERDGKLRTVNIRGAKRYPRAELEEFASL